MKKVFSKELWKKFLASIMLMISFMWLAPEKIQADEGFGGKLAEPVADLVIFVGDALLKVSHLFVLGKDYSNTLIRVNKKKSFWSIVAGVVATVAIAAISVGLAIATFGASAVIEAVAAGSLIAGVCMVVTTAARSGCWVYSI